MKVVSIDVAGAVREIKPLGVATYKMADEMPERLKRALPPIDELRRQLEI